MNSERQACSLGNASGAVQTIQEKDNASELRQWGRDWRGRADLRGPGDTELTGL